MFNQNLFHDVCSGAISGGGRRKAAARPVREQNTVFGTIEHYSIMKKSQGVLQRLDTGHHRPGVVWSRGAGMSRAEGGRRGAQVGAAGWRGPGSRRAAGRAAAQRRKRTCAHLCPSRQLRTVREPSSWRRAQAPSLPEHPATARGRSQAPRGAGEERGACPWLCPWPRFLGSPVYIPSVTYPWGLGEQE